MRKTSAIIISFILFLYFISSGDPVRGNYPSDQKNKGSMSSGGSFFTQSEGGMLSVDIRDETLKKVLEQLSKTNGISFILPPSLEGDKVMIRFSNLRLDEGIDKILHPYNRIFLYSDHPLSTDPRVSPDSRLTEVRIFPHEYEGRVKEPLTRISEGSLEQVDHTDKQTRTYVLTRPEKERVEASMKTWSSTLKGRDSERKLEAIQSLKQVGSVKAIEALTVAMQDKNPKVKEEAVVALKKIGETISDEGVSDVTSEQEPETGQEPAEEGEAGHATLRLGSSTGMSANVELSNDVPVKGVQFNVTGATEVRTTSRTEGFFAKVNESNGAVVLLSLSGKTIAPGDGPIAEVVCKNGSTARLSNPTIAK